MAHIAPEAMRFIGPISLVIDRLATHVFLFTLPILACNSL